MSEHLRYLSRHARDPAVRACRTPACPMLGRGRRALPADPGGARRRARARSSASSALVAGRRLLRHHPGAPAPGRRAGRAAARRRRAQPAPRAGRRLALPARAVPPGHHRTWRSASGPTPTAPRRSARRCWRAAGTTASRSPATRSATARTCSTCASTTSAATASPTCGRSPAGSPPPRPCRSCSTPPSRRCSRPGLEMLGGRAVINSVNFEDGDGPDVPVRPDHAARRASTAPRVVALTIDEEGQARTAEWKVRVAERLIDDLTGNWGMRIERHPRRLPDLPDRHRPGGDPPRRHRDDRGDPRAQAPPPGRADHARPVQRLLRPEPGRPAGAQLGLPARVRQGRPGLGDRARVEDPADARDPRRAARGRARPGLRPRAARATTRCSGSWSCSRASTPQSSAAVAGRGAGRAAAGGAAAAADHRRRAQRPGGRPRRGAEHAAGPRHHQRHPAGRHEGRRRAVRLRPDAAAVRAAVGRGDEGRRRLPRTAHGEGRRRPARARSCWPRSRATCTTSARTWSTSSCPTTATRSSTSASSSRSSAILDAAEEHDADAIGMSGLLVKSHGDHEGEPRGDERPRASADRYPVLLGGAALTRALRRAGPVRALVERLAALFVPQRRYAAEAFPRRAECCPHEGRRVVEVEDFARCGGRIAP